MSGCTSTIERQATANGRNLKVVAFVSGDQKSILLSNTVSGESIKLKPQDDSNPIAVFWAADSKRFVVFDEQGTFRSPEVETFSVTSASPLAARPAESGPWIIAPLVKALQSEMPSNRDRARKVIQGLLPDNRFGSLFAFCSPVDPNLSLQQWGEQAPPVYAPLEANIPAIQILGTDKGINVMQGFGWNRQSLFIRAIVGGSGKLSRPFYPTKDTLALRFTLGEKSAKVHRTFEVHLSPSGPQVVEIVAGKTVRIGSAKIIVKPVAQPQDLPYPQEHSFDYALSIPWSALQGISSMKPQNELQFSMEFHDIASPDPARLLWCGDPLRFDTSQAGEFILWRS